MQNKIVSRRKFLIASGLVAASLAAPLNGAVRSQ